MATERLLLDIRYYESDHENGGFCDCEALANAEEAWRSAIHDVSRREYGSPE